MQRAGPNLRLYVLIARCMLPDIELGRIRGFLDRLNTLMCQIFRIVLADSHELSELSPGSGGVRAYPGFNAVRSQRVGT
jgi:hypothetical protein